jgi:hypothetical protein
VPPKEKKRKEKKRKEKKRKEKVYGSRKTRRKTDNMFVQFGATGTK